MATSITRQAIDQAEGRDEVFLDCPLLVLGYGLPVVVALRFAISPHDKKDIFGLYLYHKGEYHRPALGLLEIKPV